jgi:hypothetical protein
MVAKYFEHKSIVKSKLYGAFLPKRLKDETPTAHLKGSNLRISPN